MPPARQNIKDLFDLESQRFVVCGAGQGIGAACARAVHDLGAEVLCVDLDAGLAQGIAAELDGTWLAADLLTEEGVAALAEASGDRVDGLVDIIGAATRSSIDDLDPTIWDRDFAINLRHAYLLGREFGPRMARQEGGGSMTFVASIVSSYGTHVTPAYHAAKAALVSWMKSLAVSYGPQGVRANTVSPGVVRTKRMEGHWKAAGITDEDIHTKNVLKVVTEPEDIGAAVAFLASPAARMITGHDLLVDAGTKARDPFYGDPQDERGR